MGSLGKHWKLSNLAKEKHRICALKNNTGKFIRTIEHKKKLSEYMVKRWRDRKFRKKMAGVMKNNKFAKDHKRSDEHKRKISEFIKRTRNQENNPNWKGGRKREHKILYGSRRYSEWRKLVFERDNYQCQNKECGIKSGQGKTVYLEAHHKKEWSKYPKLRFVISNGITLCKKCHDKTKKGRKK